MRYIHVSASKKYDVLIGRDLLKDAGELILGVLPKVRSVMLVSDSNVSPLYGDTVKAALEAKGLSVHSFVFPAGEESKTLATYSSILAALAGARLTRTDAVVALGGGVTGDLSGFAAATYQRGMGFVQIPTTLLAMVDSSVGGKTAVDLPEGKNLVGAFYQPDIVICDTDTLATLPFEIFRDGCAEVIKYGILGNRDFYEELKATPIKDQAEHVIATSVAMKRDIVQQDEYDLGLRRLLNLGHTFGHAAEKCSEFGVSHGSAVAIGIAMAARAACSFGYLTAESRDDIIATLRAYDLPTETVFGVDELFAAALSDKKMTGSTMNLVVPKEIGVCVSLKVPADELKDWIKAGLSV